MRRRARRRGVSVGAVWPSTPCGGAPVEPAVPWQNVQLVCQLLWQLLHDGPPEVPPVSAVP